MHAHWPSVLSDELWIWVGFLIAFVGLGLLEWLEQRSRLADLGVRGISTLWAPSLLVGAGWMAVVTTGNPFSFIWFIVLMLPTVGHPKPGPAAEGALQQRIKELGRKARVRISDPHTWSWGETNACIVHDTFRWWPATATSVSYIFVPLRFLGWMSRGEIDALVARRFRAKRPQGKSQGYENITYAGSGCWPPPKCIVNDASVSFAPAPSMWVGDSYSRFSTQFLDSLL